MIRVRRQELVQLRDCRVGGLRNTGKAYIQEYLVYVTTDQSFGQHEEGNIRRGGRHPSLHTVLSLCARHGSTIEWDVFGTKENTTNGFTRGIVVEAKFKYIETK